MDNNLITTIPPLPLPHLETLSLRSNKIAGSLSKDLFKTCNKTLKQLCLSSNELTSFDLVESLKELKVVEKVYLNKVRPRVEERSDELSKIIWTRSFGRAHLDSLVRTRSRCICGRFVISSLRPSPLRARSM